MSASINQVEMLTRVDKPAVYNNVGFYQSGRGDLSAAERT